MRFACGVVTVAAALLFAAVWVAPIDGGFSLSGHLVVTAAVVIGWAFTLGVALPLFDYDD